MQLLNLSQKLYICCVPTILKIRGYRFFFFSREGNEPKHIHVEQGDRYAKFWLIPVQLVKSEGFRSAEISELRKLVPRVVDLSFTSDSLRVILADGREISAPLEWFPRLRDANAKQRKNWRLIGRGIGIHWEEIDEDISVNSLLTIN